MKRLLIYYGYPSCVNRVNDAAKAVGVFEAYDVVVFAGSRREFRSIEFEEHEDHNAATYILGKLRNERFGYIACGNRPGIDSCWTTSEIDGLAERWANLQANGVLLDEFGRDYGNSPERQTDIAGVIRGCGLSVMINAWNPADVFERMSVPLLGRYDYYLMESFSFFAAGDGTRLQSEESLFGRTIRLRAYRERYPFQVAAVDVFGEDFQRVKGTFIDVGAKIADFLSVDAYGISKKDYHASDVVLVDFTVDDSRFSKDYSLRKRSGKYWRSDARGVFVKWPSDASSNGESVEIRF